MRLFTAFKESKIIIKEIGTISEGLKLIAEYEKADKRDKLYLPGAYDIIDIDDNYESVL